MNLWHLQLLDLLLGRRLVLGANAVWPAASGKPLCGA
jgi:hypothetical protein